MKNIIYSLFLITSILLIGNVANAVQQSVDTCKESDAGDIDARNDVDILSATYDPTSASIKVCASLCDNECMPKTQYRFHFDYDEANGMASELESEDRDYGSCSISFIGNNTGTTSDDTVRFVCDNDGTNFKKITGPAESCTSVDEDGEFCCTVFVSELVREDGSMVQECEFIDIWIDAQNKGIQDRGPDTDHNDGCSKPTGEDEVLPFVVDGTPPVITCPAGTTIECDESTDPSNTGMATAVDNCDPDPTIDFNDAIAPSACPQASTITRTWTATDFANNANSCDQIINVVDTTPPVLTCPADMEVVFDDLPIFAVSYTDPTPTDNCDTAPTVVCTPASGSIFNEGDTTVTCTANDSCGNSTSCSFTVTVIYNNPTETCIDDCDQDYDDDNIYCETINSLAQQSCNNDFTSCKDDCDYDLTIAWGICQGYHVQAYNDCENTYDSCLPACGGDSTCETECGIAWVNCQGWADTELSSCTSAANGVKNGCYEDCDDDKDACMDSAYWDKLSCLNIAQDDKDLCYGDCYDICIENCEDVKTYSWQICQTTHVNAYTNCDTAQTTCETGCDSVYATDITICDNQYYSDIEDCDGNTECEANAESDRQLCYDWADEVKLNCVDDCDGDHSDCYSDADSVFDTCINDASAAESDCEFQCEVMINE